MIYKVLGIAKKIKFAIHFTMQNLGHLTLLLELIYCIENGMIIFILKVLTEYFSISSNLKLVSCLGYFEIIEHPVPII